MLIKQNSIGMALSVGFVENAGGYSVTGALTVFVAKNGGAFVASVGSASVRVVAGYPNTVLQVFLGAGDDDTLGSLRWMVVDGGTSIPYISDEDHQVVAFDPNASSDPWAVALPGGYTAGQAGYLLGHTSGDPWLTTVPGAYTAGQAGYALGNMALATASVVLSSPNSIDVGLSLAQAVKLVTAVLCGVTSVSGFVVTFMDTTDSIARVVATLDGTGQRTVVVYNTA